MTHEEAVIRAFVARSKRDRYLEFAASPKRQRKFIDVLYHFRDFESSRVVGIPPSKATPTGIAVLLRSRGAPAECYVISTNDTIDQRTMALGDALEAILGYGHGTILSCLPGKLAYFEGEGPGDRCILATE